MILVVKLEKATFQEDEVHEPLFMITCSLSAFVPISCHMQVVAAGIQIVLDSPSRLMCRLISW